MRRHICRWRGHPVPPITEGDLISTCRCRDRTIIAMFEGDDPVTVAATLRIRAGNEDDEELAAWLRAAADEITQEAT